MVLKKRRTTLSVAEYNETGRCRKGKVCVGGGVGMCVRKQRKGGKERGRKGGAKGEKEEEEENDKKRGRVGGEER